MTLLLLLHGAGTASLTPIAFGNTAAVICPDEVAVGLDADVWFEVFDSTGRKTLDGPPQLKVVGYSDVDGSWLVASPLAAMTEYVGSDLWVGSWVPPKNGNFRVQVVGEVGGTAFVATRAVTARAKFDPVNIATEGEFATRMDTDPTLLDGL